MVKLSSLFICLSVFLVSIAENIQLAKIPPIENKYSAPSSKNETTSVWEKLETRLRIYPKAYEADLLKAVLYFKSGKLELALGELDRLIKKVPDSQLAYLLKGDLLLSKFSDVNNLG